MSESTDPGEPSRRELDELLAALRQPPRADELHGETEAVASMVSALGSPTDDRASRQRSRSLHLAAVAAGLVFVVAGAAAATPQLLKTAGTRSVVPSATSTVAIAQAGGNKPQTSSAEPAPASSRIDDDASPPPTTQADAPPEPAMTQPDGEVVASCVDRDLGASTSSTIRDSSPADSRSSPSAPMTTLPLCGQPADDGRSALVSSAPGQAEDGTHDSDRSSNTAPGHVGQPGPGADSPANTAPGQVGQPGSDSPANTAPGRLDRPASDERRAVDRLHGPQQSDRPAAEEDTENVDSGPGEDNSEEEPDD